MAEKRMFAKTIIDSDSFIDMPLSTQALYFHLSMRADDEGFINNPKKIQRMIGASDDDLKVLIAKNFIIPFESGIVVIKHWKIHNYIRADRIKNTVYKEEASLLEVKDNGAYTLTEDLSTICQTDVCQVTDKCQHRLDKNSIDKIRLDKNSKETTLDIFHRIKEDYFFTENTETMIEVWLNYKKDRKEKYEETSLKSLLTRIKKNIDLYGEDVVLDLIDESISNRYQGITWDKLKKIKPAAPSYIDKWRDA